MVAAGAATRGSSSAWDEAMVKEMGSNRTPSVTSNTFTCEFLGLAVVRPSNGLTQKL